MEERCRFLRRLCLVGIKLLSTLRLSILSGCMVVAHKSEMGGGTFVVGRLSSTAHRAARSHSTPRASASGSHCWSQ
jgi:hypothetical protein